jgi:transcriptional antiterminator RfaH
MEPAWYCLRSKQKHEHIAAAHLRELDGVSVFCPRVRFKRETRQGLVWVTEAMFPSYLFARFDLAEMHRQVTYTHSVREIVRFAERYPTIEDDVLEELRECVGAADIQEMGYTPSAGDRVRIAEGVFAGVEGVVTHILPARERVRVLMEFLGRRTEAEVKLSSVLLVPGVACGALA